MTTTTKKKEAWKRSSNPACCMTSTLLKLLSGHGCSSIGFGKLENCEDRKGQKGVRGDLRCHLTVPQAVSYPRTFGHADSGSDDGTTDPPVCGRPQHLLEFMPLKKKAVTFLELERKLTAFLIVLSITSVYQRLHSHASSFICES